MTPIIPLLYFEVHKRYKQRLLDRLNWQLIFALNNEMYSAMLPSVNINKPAIRRSGALSFGMEQSLPIEQVFKKAVTVLREHPGVRSIDFNGENIRNPSFRVLVALNLTERGVEQMMEKYEEWLESLGRVGVEQIVSFDIFSFEKWRITNTWTC